MGADGYFALINQTEHVGAMYGLHPYRVRHLLDRYGSLIGEVLAMAEGRPELLAPITEAPVYLKVEAWYAAAAEGALHLEDILARRMRISIEYPHRGVDCAREVAEVVAPVLGWSAEDVDREVNTYIGAGRGRGACRSSSPTTSPPTRCGPRPPRRAPRSSSRCRSIETCRAVAGARRAGPARVRLRGGAVLVELADRFGEAAAAKVLAGEVVCADGAVVTAATVLPPGARCLPLP